MKTLLIVLAISSGNVTTNRTVLHDTETQCHTRLEVSARTHGGSVNFTDKGYMAAVVEGAGNKQFAVCQPLNTVQE